MGFLKGWLIDECLSPKLAEVATSRSQSAWHVNHRGLARRADPLIARWCVGHDLVLVTNNARDFRRVYANFELHPGLVILLPRVERPDQIVLFGAVLDRVATEPDLINKLVEIDAAGAITIMDWPA